MASRSPSVHEEECDDTETSFQSTPADFSEDRCDPTHYTLSSRCLEYRALWRRNIKRFRRRNRGGANSSSEPDSDSSLDDNVSSCASVRKKLRKVSISSETLPSGSSSVHEPMHAMPRQGQKADNVKQSWNPRRQYVYDTEESSPEDEAAISRNSVGLRRTGRYDNKQQLCARIARRFKKDIDPTYRWLGDIYVPQRMDHLFDFLWNWYYAGDFSAPFVKGAALFVCLHTDDSLSDRDESVLYRFCRLIRHFAFNYGARGEKPAQTEEVKEIVERVGTRFHVHVYHSCKFRNSYCRCSFLRGVKLKRRFGRRVLYCDTVSTSEYIVRWIEYFSRAPRLILDLQVREVSYLAAIRRLKGVFQREGAQKRNRYFATLAISELSSEDSDREPVRSCTNEEDEGSDKESAECSTRERPKVPGRNHIPTTQEKRKVLQITTLYSSIKKILSVPISATCDHELWLSDPYLAIYDKTDRDYIKAAGILEREVQHMSIQDICQLTKECHNSQPAYYSRHKNNYYTITESVNICNDLLLYQCGSKAKVCEFLKQLYIVLERKGEKRNSIFILGPPNSGKSFFFDAVAAFFLNVGHVGNFCKNSGFPLNDCYNRRILIWNEPQIDDISFDMVKMLAGGDPCNAKIKYQNDACIQKTPLIFLSNKSVFSISDEVWRSRIAFYSWHSAPILKSCTRYPNPLFLPTLFYNYNIH